MTTNQLFKIIPDMQIITLLLESFGLDSLEDTRFFTKTHMKEIQTVEKITNIRDKLNEYYIPCKSKQYLYGINEKRVLTILRQFIRIFNYSLYSKDKSSKGKKETHYCLMYMNKDSLSPVKSEDNDRKIILHFDI